MPPTKSFAEDQPRDGDTILHCGHFGGEAHDEHTAHWFKLSRPTEFRRPDGTCGLTEWFCACTACFTRHGKKALNFVRGDAVWQGDDPVIESVEDN